MRGNSDKQTRSFTTGQTTSQRKRGARDNRSLDNTHRSLSYQKQRDKTNAGIRDHANKSQTWEYHTTQLNVACH